MTRPLLARWPCGRRLLHRLVAGCAARLPLPVARMVAWLIGTCAWFVDASGRRRVQQHLTTWRPDARTRRSYVQFCLMVADSGALARRGHRRRLAAAMGLVDPWGVFTRPPFPGPAIIATLHANWELLGALTRTRDLLDNLTSLVLPSGDPRLDGFFAGLRQRCGHGSLLLDAATPRAALELLRGGGILGMAVDRDYAGNGIEVRFGRHRQRVPRGPVRFARTADCPVLPLLLLRVRSSGYLLFVEQPFRVAAEEEPATAAQRLIDRLEPRLARDPAQWVAFHRDPPPATG